MPSNKELTAQAEELAKELELEINTEGLKNDGLAELVSDLKAKKKDADRQTLADEAEEDSAKAAALAKLEADEAKEDKAEAKKPPFYVMPGKCLTSKRGLIADGDEIKADDLAGGKEALNAFVKSGHVGKA